jgi:hypothetical protein
MEDPIFHATGAETDSNFPEKEQLARRRSSLPLRKISEAIG